MPIEALTKKQLEERVPPSSLHPEYMAFMDSARLGSGGKLEVAKEGATRQTVKKRLKLAAQAAGKNIAFQRSPSDLVIFQIVE